MKIRFFFLAVLISLTSVPLVFAAPADCQKECVKKTDAERRICMALPGSRVACFKEADVNLEACSKACG